MRRVGATLAFLCMALPLARAAGRPEARTERPVSLVIWTHEDANRTAIEERYIAEFTAANPGVRVRRVTQSSDKLVELIRAAFAADQGPDVFNMELQQEYAYIANGRVAPLDPGILGFTSLEELSATYVPNVLDPVTKDGKLYGLPLEITNWCVYVNKKMFRAAGLDPQRDYPRTWEDVARISERLVRRDGSILARRGFDFRYPYYLIEIVPMAEQLGGRLVSNDGKTAIVNDAAWLALLKFMREWGPSGRNLGSPTYKASRSLFNFDNDEVAMASSGLYQEGRMKKDNPAFYASGQWMVIPFPVFKDAVTNVAACYYGHYYMVNAQCGPAQRTAAWRLIGYMLEHGEEYLTEVNTVQPTKALLASDAYKNLPYCDVFRRDMERAHMVYHQADAADLQKAIRTAVESVMLSGTAPEKALAALKAEAQEILDER